MRNHLNKQKKRLRWLLLVFFIVLSLPVYYLLQTVYGQLENEAYFTARHQAETVVDQLERNLQQILKTEQNRPIAEYQFFNVMVNPLLSENTGVKFSPLSVIPPKTGIKGLIGYFQINTDGSFHMPALPEVEQDNLSGLSLLELESRLALKQKLRDLLSINVTGEIKEELAKVVEDNEVDEMEMLGSTAHELKDTFPQPITEKMTMTMPMKKKVKAKAFFKTESYSQSIRQRSLNKKSAKKYNTRRETVQLPDQSMASSYFNRAKQQHKSISGLSKNDDKNIGYKESSDSAINILSYESEVTPLQLLLIGQDYFCFYRYIWHDNNRYTQGFIVNNHEFLNTLVQPLISSTDFSQILFEREGDVLQVINKADISAEIPLYRRHLSAPFQKLELVISAAKLSNPPGALLIDLLAFAIFSILLIGFVIFYRLASKQIELATQQQNFISAVSHELKTPLTSIRMYGEMLRSGWVTDKNKKQSYYDFIFFESERLSRLISNVLQLARLGHQQQSTEIVTVSAQSLLDKITSKVDAQIQSSAFTLNIIQPIDQDAEITVDEDAFFQIVINLMDNAIKFANHAENRQIDIGFNISKNHKQLSFFVRDYGSGIKNNQMKKIFQLFYRSGDEMTRTTPGTGIGLALVAQLAETMGASINVTNKQPGAEFRIKFPVVSLIASVSALS